MERGWKWMDAWIAFEKIKLPPTASTILINYSCTLKSYAVIRQLVFLQQTYIWNNNNSTTMNWLDKCFVVIGYFLLKHHFYLFHVDYLWFPLTENQTWHEHRMHFQGNLSRNKLSNTSPGPDFYSSSSYGWHKSRRSPEGPDAQWKPFTRSTPQPAVPLIKMSIREELLLRLKP